MGGGGAAARARNTEEEHPGSTSPPPVNINRPDVPADPSQHLCCACHTPPLAHLHAFLLTPGTPHAALPLTPGNVEPSSGQATWLQGAREGWGR